MELGAGETAGNGRSHFSGNSVPLIPGVKAGNLSHQPEFPGAQLLGVVLCRSEQLTSQATTLQVRNYRQVSQNEVPCTVLEGGWLQVLQFLSLHNEAWTVFPEAVCGRE